MKDIHISLTDTHPTETESLRGDQSITKTNHIMTLKEALSSKYPAYADKLAERFREANGVDMDWSNITKSSLARFAEHLQSVVARSPHAITAPLSRPRFRSTMMWSNSHADGRTRSV